MVDLVHLLAVGVPAAVVIPILLPIFPIALTLGPVVGALRGGGLPLLIRPGLLLELRRLLLGESRLCTTSAPSCRKSTKMNTRTVWKKRPRNGVLKTTKNPPSMITTAKTPPESAPKGLRVTRAGTTNPVCISSGISVCYAVFGLASLC